MIDTPSMAVIRTTYGRSALTKCSTQSRRISRGWARRANIVIDTVGGKEQGQLFGVVKTRGIIVSSVVRPSRELAQKYNVTPDYLIVDVNGGDLAQLIRMRELGELTIPVGSILSLEEAVTAHEMLALACDNRQTVGDCWQPFRGRRRRRPKTTKATRRHR